MRRFLRVRVWFALSAASLPFACSSSAPRGEIDGADGTAFDAPSDGWGNAAGDGATPDTAALDDAAPGSAGRSDSTVNDPDAADATTSDATAKQAPPEDAVPETAAGDANGDALVPGDGEGSDSANGQRAVSDSALDEGATLDASSEDSVTDASAESAVERMGDGAPVVPVLSHGDYVFASGDLSLEIDPQAGARVVSFALAGKNVLTGPDASATNYGSTFWTSPQSDWSWPPPAELDSLPYVATVDGGALILRGSQNLALGVRMTKIFSVDPASDAVTIEYTIENVGTFSRSFAPWEVTRVDPNGLVFFPTGSLGYSSDAGSPLPTRQASGATWFDGRAAAVNANTKYFANGSRGWLAQVSGGALFVEKFADVTPDAQAPGEAEIELYVSGDHAYVELESQGSYAPIAAGAARQWTVRWYLVRTPAGIDASVGNAALVSFVDALR